MIKLKLTSATKQIVNRCLGNQVNFFNWKYSLLEKSSWFNISTREASLDLGFWEKADKTVCIFFFLFCTDACGDLMVTLQSVSRQGEKRNLQLSGNTDSVAFTFENVPPGKYKSRNMGICWKC